MFAPIWELAQLHGMGPRVEEPGLGLIELNPFSSPYEDLRLRKLARRGPRGPRPQGAKNAASGTAAACSVNGNTERPE